MIRCTNQFSFLVDKLKRDAIPKCRPLYKVYTSNKLPIFGAWIGFSFHVKATGTNHKQIQRGLKMIPCADKFTRTCFRDQTILWYDPTIQFYPIFCTKDYPMKSVVVTNGIGVRREQCCAILIIIFIFNLTFPNLM